jgi:hypothetical protein
MRFSYVTCRINNPPAKTVITDETLKLFIDSAGGDSAGGQNREFGIYFQGKWAQKGWSKDWEKMGILTF